MSRLGEHRLDIYTEKTDRRLQVLEAAPGAPVDSVFARVGTVLAALSDYDASQIDNDSGVAGATVAAALDTLAATAGLDNDAIELFEGPGGQNITAGPTKITFSTTRTNTDGAVFSVAISEIEALVAGTYKISAGIAGDYNGISTMHQMGLQTDLGAGFVEIAGTFREVNNNSGTTTGSAYVSAIVTGVSAGDKFAVVLLRLTAFGNYTIDPGGANFSVERLLS